jgi:hypothetical protein
MVKFQYPDAALLYCIPVRGCDLRYLVPAYVFFDRTSVPSYETIAGFLSRASIAGIIFPPTTGADRYRVRPDWYARIHDRDVKFTASEYAAADFSEELEDAEYPEVGSDFSLDEQEYREAADCAQERLDRLFEKRNKPWWQFW